VNCGLINELWVGNYVEGIGSERMEAIFRNFPEKPEENCK
jgi:hypothetical protein